jgi:phosphoribosylformimino-5-aminoimidazole carboxamide ribotide isomerase
MIEIIPPLNLDGKCVRCLKGIMPKKRFITKILSKLQKCLKMPLQTSHLVDLDGAKAHHIVNHKVLEKIATHTSLLIDFGGGLKSDDDLRIAFECGAKMITGGSIAVKNPEVFTSWIHKFGAEKIIRG